MTDISPGKIITFYSFKGGTGRSMALANVAWILACNGKRVLTIDWDLEAPGLHRYFSPFLIDKDLSASDGIIDFVMNFALEAVTPPDSEEPKPDWYVPHANILRYAVSLDFEFPRPGRLDFVPAGRQGLSYPTRVNSFDWQKFYERLGGGLFLEEAKKRMREEYDYILIDSRTGVSDTSGICTIQMPDILVACFTLNNQGIEGAVKVANTVFDQRKESGLRVFPVPMRLDNAESDKLERRSKEAEDRFFPFPNHLNDGDWREYWNDVPVIYVPYYSYEEVLAVFAQGRRTGSVLAAAEKLTKYLTGVEGMTPDTLPSQEVRDRVLALYAGQPVTINLEEEFNRVAENALAPLSAEEREGVRRIVLRLVKVDRSATAWTARQGVALDKFPLTEQRIIQELRNRRVFTVEPDGSTGRQTVQLAQDEILRGWQRLQKWVQDDREFLMWLSGLRVAQERWERARLDAGPASRDVENPGDLLLDGDDLASAQKWLKNRYADIYPAERRFIEASQERSVGRVGPAGTQEPQKYQTIPTRAFDSGNIALAKAILRGQQTDPREMLELSKRLKQETRFSYARRILLRASRLEGVTRDKTLRQTIVQQLALCTYKDQDLPADQRLTQALSILDEIEDASTTTNQETLGLLGSIFKRKFEVDAQRRNLERSLEYYMRGYNQGPFNDQGYTGINAAFLLDQLASLEEGDGETALASSAAVEQRRALAREIRQKIVDQVGPLVSDPQHRWVADKWWYYATMAEAHFGLRNYDEAIRWLRDGQDASRGVYEWEIESCARQLAALALLQSGESTDVSYTPAFIALEKAFGAHAVPRTAFRGKIGLAMSGGGFRASLYHLGMLAQLAELDVLRQVEVLSCVSGGSIVGAYYYLMVRHLLQSKTEDEIRREDYIDIVKKMIEGFVKGVQENIRTRVVVNPLKNLEMFFDSDYSRTKRAGELYETCLYSRIEDGEQHAERWLNKLTIAPLTKGENGQTYNDQNFSPKYQNWRRDAKVPILVLNAATLNTGHTWQFTATWMGESPAGIDSEIDGNDRLRRMYYTDAPAEHRQIRLGYAVGASAAVPGIFEPVTFDRLYPDRIIRLVDGGVCDNQGTGSLLEQDCKVMLVSDASGQMNSVPAASRGIFGVLLRTNSIFQARIREAEYHDLKGRKRSGLLNGFMFVHLKGDLEVDPVDWVDCQDRYDASDEARPPARRGPLTRYGISKEIQQLLSGIRTDLDSFSEVEAYALMTSGYRMTEYQFKYEKCVEGFVSPRAPEPWTFLQIEESMKVVSERYNYLKTLLAAGSSSVFKVWQIDPALKYSVRFTLLAITAVVGTLLYSEFRNPGASLLSEGWMTLASWLAQRLESVSQALVKVSLQQMGLFVVSLFGVYLVTLIVGSLVGDVVARNALRAVRWKDTLRRVALAAFVSTIGFGAAFLHLRIFDKKFLSLSTMGALSKRRNT